MRKKYIIFDFDGTLIDSKTKELFEEIPQMLKSLSKEYTLFLSSSADDEDLVDFLKTEQLYGYFDVVFGGTIREK
jgi:phosphoglycolate phosphatase-like HAD superfamily hydrolase